MILSKERLIKEQKTSGYRQEIIEKVIWLIQVLNIVAEDSFLKTRLALKGGTALNLFYFNLPCLSVDADLNYIGAVERDIMMLERPEIETRIHRLFQQLGLTAIRNPKMHAGGKMTYRYPSALGNKGNIEVDLNFMYRTPIFPIEFKNSIELASQHVKQMPLLDFHEIAAGKLTALIDRRAGRDVFDTYHLFQYPGLDIKKLRLCFVIYAAMSHKKNFQNLTVEDVDVDEKDLHHKLIPVLKNNFSAEFKSISDWIDYLLKTVKSGFEKLVPFEEQENLFIKTVTENGKIQPELITKDPEIANKIKSHPGLLWAIKKESLLSVKFSPCRSVLDFS